ncbi:hypothetical protein F444_08373 [Phytophthora nicotianae P1976]|uniref:SWIM-type domain-containing protein n=2 Tax=Phytophthora nicotianae TaxID=4792 RepID=A0A081ABE3_PHYNI|nr:hypothetical protein F444_08373 [Phytophthora nicotianae P1976]
MELSNSGDGALETGNHRGGMSGGGEVEETEEGVGDDQGSDSGGSSDDAEGTDDASGDELVHVEPPAVWHPNWDAWQSYFTLYCDRTMQGLPVKETMSRSERNKRLRRTKKGADDSQLVPDQFDPYQRTYICTHGWKKRKSRGEGSRPRQHIRLTDCPFRFVVQWNLSRGELQVKNGCFKHNHRVSAAAYATYPTSRGVTNPLVGARVDGMLADGAKRSRIYDYLLDQDQNMIQVDVDNLVREHASSVASVDDNDATAREIAVFSAADPENVSSVAETESGETGVISLTTAHMRRMFGRFSELLMVDCSHKTNRYNYQLLTFMSVNEFGEGCVVQQSLIKPNGDWHMERAIAHFKRSHPTKIDQLRVIVVDKDLNEIRVLETNFPEARLLICHFHVIKYLKEMRSKPDFGKISGEDASQVDALVHKMVYARSEENYDETCASLKGLCERIGIQGFWEYFDKNWNSCQDRWAMYRRQNLPHFKNHTNNRLESFFGKLKDSADSSMSMSTCVKAVLAYDRRVENEYKYRLSRIGMFVNSNYDEEMRNVLRFTTHYVAEQIEHQYASALEKYESYTFTAVSQDDDIVEVWGSTRHYTLRLDDWCCDCEFSISMSLPCRHAIAYRKKEGVAGPLIPWNCIHERRTTPTKQLKKFRGAGTRPEPKPLRSQAERYREAVRATHLIANELADIDDEDEFNTMLEFILSQWRNVRQRKIANTQADDADDAREGIQSDSNPARGAQFDDAAIKAEFEISSSGDDDTGSNEDEESIGVESKVKIRLNPKTRKVGRPKKDKSKTVVSEKVDRQWFEAMEKGRKTAGEVTLEALLAALLTEEPTLSETQRRLSRVMVKHNGADLKKPKFKMLKNPVLIMDAFYILPPKLMDACMKVLPLANTQSSAISVDEDRTKKKSQTERLTECVHIKGIGTFSRAQIELFKRVQNLKDTVQLGVDAHKWLLEGGLPSLPAGYHDLVRKVADDVEATFPYRLIPGLPQLEDYQYSLLYRAVPGIWLSDEAIRAVCERLVTDFPSCRFAGFVRAETTKKRTRNTDEMLVDSIVRNRISTQVAESGVDTVFLPLNFMNYHWCCIVIKVQAKRIFFYDPLNQGPYRNSALAIANYLKISGLSDYDVVSQNNPLQFDGSSCGVYVAWMFIRQGTPVPALDMSKFTLPRRRFELFYYLLTGRLLPIQPVQAVGENLEDEEMEEKPPAPTTTQQRNEEEEVPPTQVSL